MIKETDLDGLKAISKTLLMTEIHKTRFSPMIVQHPFTSSGIVAIPSEQNNFFPTDITTSKENLRKWQTAMKQLIDKADNPFQIYLMINPPYGLTFLKFASPYLSKKDFSEILSNAWIVCEAPHNDPDVSVRRLVSMFKSADPKSLMDEGEYEAFLQLDDTVTVYRGVTRHNAKNVKALSWTLNQETAEWFAHRFNEDGTVYEAQIEKQHIYALFNGRNESEVILDPKYLTDISEVQDMTSDFSISM